MQKRKSRYERKTRKQEKIVNTPLVCDYSCDAQTLGVCKECLEWALMSARISLKNATAEKRRSDS